jgi:hypothetical protein
LDEGFIGVEEGIHGIIPVGGQDKVFALPGIAVLQYFPRLLQVVVNKGVGRIQENGVQEYIVDYKVAGIVGGDEARSLQTLLQLQSFNQLCILLIRQNLCCLQED